jgi:hypothetical protein
MAKSEFDKKYLSIFIDRLIPSFWKERYPKFYKFIYYFLKYLEESGNAYDGIVNYTNSVDIDYIDQLEDEELRESLIFAVYEQYLGSREARYLSSLLDEILYLKYQKQINANKGTKANFLFFFLIILDGYFRVENIDVNEKKHNSFYNHDATVNYDRSVSGVIPYKYIVKSEFYFDQYSKVLDTLNPAGMQAIPIFQKQLGISYFFDNYRLRSILDIGTLTLDEIDLYIAIYNDEATETNGTGSISETGENSFTSGLLGVSRISSNIIYQETTDTTRFDLELQNGKLYNGIENISLIDPSKETFVFVETSFNVTNFEGQFTKLRAVYNTGLTDSSYSKEELDNLSETGSGYTGEIGTETGEMQSILYDNGDYSIGDLIAINYNNKLDVNGNPYTYEVTENTIVGLLISYEGLL